VPHDKVTEDECNEWTGDLENLFKYSGRKKEAEPILHISILLSTRRSKI
jgi:hypothetical protein